MALKTCIECGKEHTDTIANCPHCGFVTKEHPTNIDIQSESPKQSRVQGFFSAGHPLITVFKVLGMAISVFLITLPLYKFFFGFVIKYIFIVATLPYFYHKKEDHKAYKIVSYTIWLLLFLLKTHSLIVQHFLTEEEAIQLNEKIFYIFSLIF